MSGFFDAGPAGVVGTWLAAAVTLAVWAYLAGERRLFAWGQHLLAGLLTGYLVVLAVREVLLPRLAEPLLAEPTNRFDLWLALVLAGALGLSGVLPRRALGPSVGLLVAGVAAFAVGGAVVGTLLPQAAAAIPANDADAGALLAGVLGLAITVLVLLSFLHGVPRIGALAVVVSGGRWLIVVGLGAWLGLLLVTGLILLLDRIDFLLVDWLGVGG